MIVYVVAEIYAIYLSGRKRVKTVFKKKVYEFLLTGAGTWGFEAPFLSFSTVSDYKK